MGGQKSPSRVKRRRSSGARDLGLLPTRGQATGHMPPEPILGIYLQTPRTDSASPGGQDLAIDRGAEGRIDRAAVHDDLRSGHTGGGVGRQEQHRLRHLLGLAQSGHWNAGDDALQGFFNGLAGPGARVQIGVMVPPGITMLTQMPRGASSAANTFAMPVIAALLAE